MNTMQLKSPTRLTLALLSFMLAVGIISGVWGFDFGRKALKGITQPAISPVLGSNGSQGKRSQQGTTFLQEEEVLERVRAEVSGSKTRSGAEALNKPGASQTGSDSPESTLPQPEENNVQGLPVKSQNKDVTFEVRSVRRQGDQLILDVALTNSGSKPAQFLYTFLDITDEQGRVLSATTTGLPAELQPNGKAFSGTIMIPGIGLEDAQKLSLKLQDYPDQDINLEVSNIPVVR